MSEADRRIAELEVQRDGWQVIRKIIDWSGMMDHRDWMEFLAEEVEPALKWREEHPNE